MLTNKQIQAALHRGITGTGRVHPLHSAFQKGLFEGLQAIKNRWPTAFDFYVAGKNADDSLLVAMEFGSDTQIVTDNLVIRSSGELILNNRNLSLEALRNGIPQEALAYEMLAAAARNAAAYERVQQAPQAGISARYEDLLKGLLLLKTQLPQSFDFSRQQRADGGLSLTLKFSEATIGKNVVNIPANGDVFLDGKNISWQEGALRPLYTNTRDEVVADLLAAAAGRANRARMKL